MGKTISTVEELDALPVSSYLRCGCGYHFAKRTSDSYLFITGNIVSTEQVAEDHFPVVVLYRPNM